ncbi:MAG: DUF2961 domain-containing protein [Fimbriimonas sp.]|nr:DUF2961 domain-containing protein [Fimbriimonas sp.]
MWPNDNLFIVPERTFARVSSFENLNGVKGGGGKVNRGAKGAAFEYLAPGGRRTLLDVDGAGIVNRMWFTFADRSPAMLRSIRLQAFWDGEVAPAIDVPFGDFFGAGLGRCVPIHSSLLLNPRGRSFNAYFQMPFRKGARIEVINEHPDKTAQYFFDIDYLATDELPESALYFHAHWTRQRESKIGDDFVFLPRVHGKGRFVGVSFGVNRSPIYPGTGIEEGEVRMFIDGDTVHPTIHGTGAEDYIGDGWGMGVYSSPYQGCTVADESSNQFCFYRFHVPDPIYFHEDFMASIQQMGGGRTNHVRDLVREGAILKPVTVGLDGKTLHLLDMPNPPSLSDADFPDGWVNFFRIDDWSSTSYFYLDTPGSQLPPLEPAERRIA